MMGLRYGPRWGRFRITNKFFSVLVHASLDSDHQYETIVKALKRKEPEDIW